MDERRNHILLPVGDLENGKHEFDFRLESDFFAQIDDYEVHGGDVSVEIDLEKSDGYLNVEIRFDGNLKVDCDRCLEEMSVEIEGEDSLTVRFVEAHPEDDNEDVMYLKSGEDTLDLTDYIYEGIYLALPMRRIHPDETGSNACNPEMLKYLSSEKQESVSPFDILKRYKIK
jgi:uncharacterized metal-binding protein YceD (DUF177 family)